MAPRKKYYGTTEEYERKLDRVMKRFEGTAEEFEVLKKNYLACQTYLLDKTMPD